MPANLTPQYREAEERYRQAGTPAEKLLALEEMLAVIPKHKGTEHLQADIKRRISKLKQQDEKKSHGKRGLEYNVEKEGGGQVVLVGPPNSGKSRLLSRLTNARPDIGDYPFTTQMPLPGMMPYEDINIQMVDMPPITEEFTEPWMAALVRNADAALLVADASEDAVLDQIDATLKTLERFRVRLYGWDRPVPPDETGIIVFRRAILVANKMDEPQSPDNAAIIYELFEDQFPIISISCETGRNLEDLKQQIFQMLDIVRVYTKIPGKPADMKSPYILARGATLQELAALVHKDIVQKLRFARVWGRGKYDGQMISREQVLDDKDIVELHA